MRLRAIAVRLSVLALLALIAVLVFPRAAPMLAGAPRLEAAGNALASTTPPLIGAPSDWLNTGGKALKIEPGKVYLVDFWEYTCVNCIRTLPYIQAWHNRYAKDGLVVVGIHTPEFAFAKEHTNVAAAVKRFGLTYPILVDSDYRNWAAWQGEAGYWPRKFLVDGQGRVVYDHAGEGGYGETERRIQALLKKIHPGIKLPALMEPVRLEDVPGAVCYPTTREMYAGQRGFQQGQLGNVADYQVGRTATYAPEMQPEDGKFYLQGAWQTSPESLRHARATSGLPDSVTVRYHALSANAVIKPEGAQSFRLYVWQDGKPVAKNDAGADVRYDEKGQSYVTVDAPRMYLLTKLAKFGSHTLRLSTDSPDFGLYSFTFSSCVQSE